MFVTSKSAKFISSEGECRKRSKPHTPNTKETEDNTPKKQRKLDEHAELSPPSIAQATTCTCPNSNTVISLGLWFPTGEQSIPFAPTFTHQIFDDERLCVKPASRAKLYYAALSLDCYYVFVEGQDDDKSSSKPLECPENHCRKDNILKQLTARQVLPSAPITQLSDFKTILTTQIELPGEIVHRFDQTVGSSAPQKFVIRRLKMTDPASRAYFDRLQRFSLMFIDGAELVSLTDHRWSVLVVFQANSMGIETSVVGYTTLFSFWNPTRATQPRTVRVCQALVLPPFQQRGIGSRMLQLVYKDAAADAEVLEVNVEDPCPGFQHMRDVLDVSRCMDLGLLSVADTPPHRLRNLLKISPRQAVRCIEILKLSSVDKEASEEYKQYRLFVKKRLYHENLCELKTKKSDQLKRWLANVYNDLEQKYDKVLTSVVKRRAKQRQQVGEKTGGAIEVE